MLLVENRHDKEKKHTCGPRAVNNIDALGPFSLLQLMMWQHVGGVVIVVGIGGADCLVSSL